MGEVLNFLHQIDEKQLDKRHYMESLIEQAFSCSFLSESDIARIQSELLGILAAQFDKWSHGESSSLPTEKAQEMMTSILFVISIKLKTYPFLEDAVFDLKTKPLNSLFESGMEIIDQKIEEARGLQKEIVDKLLETPNVYYRSTIVDGIHGFFELYCPQFSADEIHITADYPVFAGRPESDGIEFIEQYLRCLEAENAFCIQFHPKDIHHLLCGITKDYRSVPMNLFEYVMLSASGLVLLNHHPQKLDLSKEDLEKLNLLFQNQSEEEIAECLKRAMILLKKIHFMPESTYQYLLLTLQKFVFTIRNAVKMKTLDKVFPVPFRPEQKRKISFHYGERMDDRKYRKLVGKMLRTDQSEEKIALILEEVHSLADLLDLISDTELCKEDFELLVKILPFSEFAVLLSRYPKDDFLERESEKYLYEALQNRKRSLTSVEMDKLSQM